MQRAAAGFVVKSKNVEHAAKAGHQRKQPLRYLASKLDDELPAAVFAGFEPQQARRWGHSKAAVLTADLSRSHWQTLAGPLPDEWRTSDDALPQLTTLVLANNSLSGSLPAAWANQTGIRQLTALALSFNSFTGSLPDAWGGINSFDYLRQL